jgi:hypothetical protein
VHAKKGLAFAESVENGAPETGGNRHMSCDLVKNKLEGSVQSFCRIEVKTSVVSVRKWTGFCSRVDSSADKKILRREW